MVWITYFLVMTATFGAAGFAIWKGDTAVRLGGFLRASTLVIGIPVQRIILSGSASHGQWLSYYDTGANFFTALCFLLIAFRFNNLWLGAAMVLQGSELYIDNLYIDGTIGALVFFHIWEHLVTTGIACCLCMGALADMANRRRSAGKAPRATPSPRMRSRASFLAGKPAAGARA